MTEPQPTAATTPDPALTHMQEQVAELRTMVNSLTNALQSSNEQLKVLRDERDTMKADMELQRVTSFVEGLVRDRKLRPVDKESRIATAMSIPGEVIEFSDGAGGVTSMSVRDRYLQELGAAKELWSAADMPTGVADGPRGTSAASFRAAAGYSLEPDAAQLHQRVLSYCEAHSLNAKDEAQYTQALVAVVGE
jgi:hypothetical protein